MGFFTKGEKIMPKTTPTEIITDINLPLLPLKNMAMLPNSIIPIIVGRPISIKATEKALKEGNSLFITAQKNPDIENPQKIDLFEYGTRAEILQVMRMPNGSLKILVESFCRAKVTKFVQEEEFISVICSDVPTTNKVDSAKLRALWRETKTLYAIYSQLNDKAPSDITNDIKTIEEIDFVSDIIAVHIENLTLQERQKIVTLHDLKKRIETIILYLNKEIDILQAEQRIRGRVQTQVEKNQREYYLTEQIKAIQKELGREDTTNEVEEIRQKIKNIGLSNEATKKVEKELQRLEQMPTFSSEAVVSRNYVDWITSIPWKKLSNDTVGIKKAIDILEKNHAGLKKVKEHIIEFIAAQKFSKSIKRSPVICLTGPPGVGKTSLAKSIAKSMGREFVRISLGGVRDEAEIRGHRRTYIGALPGKIIQAMKKADTVNPVILLDEIDKISHDITGDPSAALLEVLDPEQNSNFVDHFLDVGYDLSQVMFIATANVLDMVPYPLYDRLEIISISGYTEVEKIAIAERFLIPRNLKEYELTKRQFKLPKKIIIKIIEEYTKEAGVRQLERVITKLMRKTIQQFLDPEFTKRSITITPELLLDWLGYSTHKKTSLNPTNERIGLSTGLAWTEVGGDVLETEVSVLSGKGNVTLTGQLGEVMQESAQAAISYIRSRAKKLGITNTLHSSKDIHIHLPEGATPKDGPSAGITIATALISALTNNPTKQKLAMTGEITLQGRVLAIGGLKEKLLAAKQHGFDTVIVPYENVEDTKEIEQSDNITDGLNIVFVKTMDDVLKHVFINDPFLKAKKKVKPIKTTPLKRKNVIKKITPARKVAQNS